MANKLVSNDAAGGAGSLRANLLGVLTNGLSRAVDGRLARSYPLAGEQERLDDAGRPAGAPQSGRAGATGALDALKNPVVIAAAVAVALAVVIVLAVRK